MSVQILQALLDILESKPPDSYDVLLDAIRDSYPHIYLALTGHDDLADDSDDGELRHRYILSNGTAN